jgi:hypothetical protein
VDETLRRLVRQRANEACEYCRMPQSLYPHPFQVEHVIAQQHGGPTTDDNLALACQHCNLHKGPNLAGIDPVTRQLTRLFHPRRDVWEDHFEWSGHELAGRTAVGRTTVAVLAINDPLYRSVRAALLAEGAFPPTSRSSGPS